MAGRMTLAAALAMLAGTAAAEPIKVVTSFTVIADIARNVAGARAEVVSITRPGPRSTAIPHPARSGGGAGADLVLWNGLNLELWFEQFLHNLRDVPAAVVSDGIEPMPIAGGDYDGKPNPMPGWGWTTR